MLSISQLVHRKFQFVVYTKAFSFTLTKSGYCNLCDPYLTVLSCSTMIYAILVTSACVFYRLSFGGSVR